MTIQVERYYPTWTLGDRIRKARLTTGMNQREFAPLIGVKPGSLAAWESDHSVPRNMLAVARRIAGLTGIPAAWVLGLDDGPPDGGFDEPHPLNGVETTAPLLGSRKSQSDKPTDVAA
jgi:transcriptional regulator with XRE-family HTH domain